MSHMWTHWAPTNAEMWAELFKQVEQIFVFKQCLFPTQPLMFVMSWTGMCVFWSVMWMERNSCYAKLIKAVAQTQTCKARQINETSHTYESPALWTTHTDYRTTYCNCNICCIADAKDMGLEHAIMTSTNANWPWPSWTHFGSYVKAPMPSICQEWAYLCWQMTFCRHAYLADKWPFMFSNWLK